MSEAAATPPATGVGAVAPAAGTTVEHAAWHTGLSEELKGYATPKGWKDVGSVVDSYRNLEKLVGVKEKLLQVPDDLGDAKSMEAVWNRLGRPEKAEGYGIKTADEKFDKWAADTFHKAGVSGNQAKAILESLNNFTTAENTAAEGTIKAQNEQKINALKGEWGAAYEQNLNVAKAAAKQFGITAEAVTKLEQAMGFADCMKFLQNVGSKVGEASFHSGTGAAANSNVILAPAQAKEKINSLINNKEFAKKYMAGDLQAKNEMEKLNKMAVGTYE